MESINLRKAMAMGKGYPKEMKGSGKDPAPKAPMPSGDCKDLTRMKPFSTGKK